MNAVRTRMKSMRTHMTVARLMPLVFDIVSPSRVKEYASHMLTGACFPPVLIGWGEDGPRLLDGNHRVLAAWLAGADRIECDILDEAEFRAMLGENFGGRMPGQMSSMDDLIGYSGRCVKVLRDGMRLKDTLVKDVGQRREPTPIVPPLG